MHFLASCVWSVCIKLMFNNDKNLIWIWLLPKVWDNDPWSPVDLTSCCCTKSALINLSQPSTWREIPKLHSKDFSIAKFRVFPNIKLTNIPHWISSSLLFNPVKTECSSLDDFGLTGQDSLCVNPLTWLHSRLFSFKDSFSLQIKHIKPWKPHLNKATVV